MTEKEGILQMQPSGRWAVCRPGRAPVEITSGEIFRIEVDGELRPTLMEFRHFAGPLKGRLYRGQPGEYYSVDGYWLRNGLRVARAKSAGALQESQFSRAPLAPVGTPGPRLHSTNGNCCARYFQVPEWLSARGFAQSKC